MEKISGTKKSYNELIREIRTQKGWSQEELANQLGLDTNTLSRWERGERYPQPLHRRKLCEILEKTFEELGLDAEADPRRWDLVLLSYAPEHVEMAHAIQAYLRNRHIRAALYDQTEVLHAVRAMIVIASPAASQAEQVHMALDNAEERGLPVIAYWVEGQRWTEMLPPDNNLVRAIDAVDVRSLMDSDHLTLALDLLMEKLRPFLSPSSKLPTERKQFAVSKPRNPYKGLHSFDTKDAKDLYGRDHVVSTVIDSLASILNSQDSTRLFAVVGPSGSGKSSLVKAGLLPRLQQPFDELPGSSDWQYLTMRSASHPLQELERVLRGEFSPRDPHVPPESFAGAQAQSLLNLLLERASERQSKVLLFIDQFEEVFASTLEEQERQQFIDLLLEACTRPEGSLLVLLTLRADAFYGRVLSYAGNDQLGPVVDKQHCLVQRMSKHELRAAIQYPVAQPDVQVTFEEHLIEELLDDVRGQRGALPLLQFTLEQLFNQCIDKDMRCITRKAYEDSKGIKGALNEHAENLYQGLSSDQQETCKALFLRLIIPGITPEDATGLRLVRSELPEKMDDLVDTFTKARLLTIDRQGEIETVEISHEALITAWETLYGWVQDAVKDFPLRQSLYWDTKRWSHTKNLSGYLYHGDRLKEVQALQRQQLLNREEEKLVTVSTKQEQKQKRIRKIQVGCIVLVIMLLVSYIGARWYQIQYGKLIIVTSSAQNGPGSLGDALKTITDDGTIEIDSSKVHQIFLSGGSLVLLKKVTIRVIGGSPVTISSKDSNSYIHIHQDATVVIDGLVFSGSTLAQNTTGDSPIINDGTLYLVNSTIQGNRAISGGGIFNRGKLTVTNSKITNNVAYDLGGGIYNEGDSLTVQDSVISGNSARDGGGIYNLHANYFALIHTSMSNNQAHGGNGGAIASQDSHGKIDHSILSNNSTEHPTGQISNSGGAIYDQNGTLVLTNCTILSNIAHGDGGGIALNGSRAIISSCNILKNSTTHNGGAFAVEVNSDNHALSDLTVKNSNIIDNGAKQSGSVLWVEYPSTYRGIPENAGVVNSGSQPADQSLHTITSKELDQYCQSAGYQEAHLDNQTAYGWACVSFDQNHFSISMTAVCQFLYPHQIVIDRIANFYDPNSWQCWLPSPK